MDKIDNVNKIGHSGQNWPSGQTDKINNMNKMAQYGKNGQYKKKKIENKDKIGHSG